jgi:hypothetical protein
MSGPAFATTSGEGDGTCIALFGHAVFLNAIAYKVAQAAGSSDDMKKFLLSMDLGETQGIWIDLATGECEHKKADTTAPAPAPAPEPEPAPAPEPVAAPEEPAAAAAAE